MKNSASQMLSSVTTGGLLSALLAPWSAGFVNYLTQSAIGYWVMFPEGYADTLLAGVTAGIIYLISYVKLRKIRHEADDDTEGTLNG